MQIYVECWREFLLRSKVNRPISVSCSKISDRFSIQFLSSPGHLVLKLQSATKLVETVSNRAHWQRHIHCLQRKLVQKVRFRDTPSSPTLINVLPLSTGLVENRTTQHCPGGAGEGAICAPSLKSTLKYKRVSTILTPIVCMKKLCMKCNEDF